MCVPLQLGWIMEAYAVPHKPTPTDVMWQGIGKDHPTSHFSTCIYFFGKIFPILLAEFHKN